MIKELKKNVVKCHNCSTMWTFNDEDVKEIKRNDQFGYDYVEYCIICPKCGNYLELYKKNGVWQ